MVASVKAYVTGTVLASPNKQDEKSWNEHPQDFLWRHPPMTTTPSAIAPFLPVVILTLASVVIGLVILFVSGHVLPRFLKPHNPHPAKLSNYECGVPLLQEGARDRYSVKFYLVAMLFLLFDVEAALLLPWAVQYRAHLWTFWAMISFFATLLIGYIYAWGKGALDWER
jgi:NADH-quinone oxidoreductase subunit A